jgi:hypothetical protein
MKAAQHDFADKKQIMTQICTAMKSGGHVTLQYTGEALLYFRY